LQTAAIKFMFGWQTEQGEQEQTAYLCFRPYLLEMLIELYPDFELILFTKGTAEYAQAVNRAIHTFYFKSKYAKQDFF